MRKVIILLLSFVMTAPGIAQTDFNQFEVEWSNVDKADRHSGYITDFFGSDQFGFYTLSSRAGSIYNVGSSRSLRVPLARIDYYTNNLKEVNSKTIDLRKMEEKRDIEAMFQMRDQRFYLFTSYLNNERENILEAQLMRPKTLQMSSNQKEIHKLSFDGYGKSNSGTYGFNMSPDSSKLVVYYNLPYERAAEEKFGLKVYDQYMNLIWAKDITLPYTDELFQLLQMRLDNKGNLYVVGKIYRDKVRNRAQGKPNYDYMVLAYKDNATIVEEFPIKLEDRFITDLQIDVDENENIICAGLYSDLGLGGIKGTFYATIDAKSKNMTSKSFKDFDADFIVEGERRVDSKKRQIARGKEVLVSYYLDEIIRRDDGGAVLVAEQYYSRVINSTNIRVNVNRRYTKYYYNDIIVVSISPAGEIEWTGKINKNQETINDAGIYSSYHLSLIGDKLIFLFNDDERNLIETDRGIRPFNGSGGMLNMVIFDSKGEKVKYPVYFQANREPVVRPRIAEQVGDQLLLVATNGRKQRIGRINLIPAVSSE